MSMILESRNQDSGSREVKTEGFGTQELLSRHLETRDSEDLRWVLLASHLGMQNTLAEVESGLTREFSSSMGV